MNKGKIIKVSGPVVDVKFQDGQIPNLLNALIIEATDSREKVTLEVASDMGDNIVRTISMTTTDGLKRGDIVLNTGAQISVPVGDKTLGRVFNVLGELIDGEADPGFDEK